MPRNSSGTYTLPAGNPVVPNTLIETTWANPTMSDIGSALTDSLDRQGRGAMSAPLKLTDGTAVAPALSFSSESTSGLYRVSAGVLGFTIAGVLAASISAAGFVPVGQFLANLGTAALPGYAFIGDTNTGMSAQVADTLVLSTAGLARHTINPAGAHTLAAPSSGITLTVSGLAGGTPFSLSDGTVTTQLNYSGSVSRWGTTSAHSQTIITNGADRITVASAGNVTLAAPTAGAGLTVNAAAASGITLLVQSPAGTQSCVQVSQTGQGAWAIYQPASSNDLRFNNGADALTINGARNVTIAAPSGGAHLAYAGAAATNLQFAAATGSTTGAIFGDYSNTSGYLRIGVETSSGGALVSGTSGYSSVISSQTNTALAIGTNTAARIVIAGAGSVTLNAPSSGDTLNVAQSGGGSTINGIITSQALSGGFATWAIRNTSNTASSDARLIVSNGGASAGDAYIVFDIAGVNDWAVGPDNSDSDTWKVDFSAAPSTSTNRFNVTTDGRIYGNALHNNAGSLTGTTNQYIASGTYTPTFTATTNVTGTPTVSTGSFIWTRIGNVVTVVGFPFVQTTAGSASPGTDTEYSISLPIASNIAVFGDLGGELQLLGSSNTHIPRGIQGDPVNDRAIVRFGATAANTQTHLVMFHYLVL